MAISKKITDYLDKNKYKYEVIPHRTTFTAWDTSQTEKVKPQEVVKCLVMKADNQYLAAVLPANRKVDKKKLLVLINAFNKKNGLKAVKKIDFANEAWMKKNIPGKVGAVPPFVGILGFAVFGDKLVFKNKKAYFGSGEYEASLRLLNSQYLKIEKPVLGNFSVKK
jgi:prolyl-tRNA editing enzyme YbaK/EbsC (Cys-tRNA(Pro) deacylase)